MNELKKRIIEYRVKHNLTNEQFAKLCNISSRMIYLINNDYEPGKFVEAKILWRLNNETNE